MWWTAIIPFVIQGLAIFFDEAVFHVRRGLPLWERIGHPLDTLTVIICMAFVVFVPFTSLNLFFYVLLAIFSTLFITKDEFVHNEHCPANEQWLHAILFVLHPITLISAGFIWPVVQEVPVTPWISSWLSNPEMLFLFLIGQLATMIVFMVYQIIYWNIFYRADHETNQ
jgi:hypothetical protein